MSLTAEAAGANCPAGGTRVASGPDTNANGTLDMAEVTTTQYVCSGAAGSAGMAGANGRSTLSSTAAESAGANCAFGGTRVQAGLDTNGNGTLEAGEVTSTGFVCNGAPGDAGAAGAPGAAGRNSLINNVAEPAGSNCATGGRRITTGVDTNGNNTLDTAEVTATSFICNDPGLLWVNVTTASIQTAVNTGYIANNTSGAVTFTLPATATPGDIVRFKNGSSPGFVVAQNAGQSINISGLNATSQSGTAWSPILNTGTSVYESRVATSADGATLLVMNSYSTTIRVSTNGGQTFTTTTPFTDPNLGFATISPNGTNMYIVSFDGLQGLYVSTDTGATWTQRQTLLNVAAIAAYTGGVLAIGTLPPSTTPALHRSTDNGATWTPIAIPGTPANVCFGSVSTSTDGTVIAVGGNGAGSCPSTPVFLSGNSGTTWSPSGVGGPFQNRAQIVNVARNGSLIVVASDVGDVPVFSTADLGATWTSSGSTFARGNPIAANDGQRIIVVGIGQPPLAPAPFQVGVFSSNDRGLTWTTTLTPMGRSLSSFAASGDLTTLYYGEARFLSSPGTQVLKSVTGPSPTATTTTGTAGSITAGANAALELQFLGAGRWGALSGLGASFLVR
ncbi:MAG: sialidase family protein [Myxococcaceae bacterium]|nr:sialidase family protein [Myxococcaceae bacterium]